MIGKCEITVDEIKQAYFANFPHAAGPGVAMLDDWPEMFRRECEWGPTIIEYENVLAKFRIEESPSPGFKDIKARILQERVKARVIRQESERPSANCAYCHGIGTISVLTVPKPGRGSRVLDPQKPEPVMGRNVYMNTQPCICAAGDRVNSEAMRSGDGEKDKPVKAYNYTMPLRQKLVKCAVTDAVFLDFKWKCENLYRQSHGLQPLGPLRPDRFDPVFQEAIDRITSYDLHQPSQPESDNVETGQSAESF